MTNDAGLLHILKVMVHGLSRGVSRSANFVISGCDEALVVANPSGRARFPARISRECRKMIPAIFVALRAELLVPGNRAGVTVFQVFRL